MTRLRTLGYAVVGLLLLAFALQRLGGTPEDGRPLDPRSVGPDGLAALVALLDELDVEVSIGLEPPADTAARVFVPLDLLDGDRSDALLDWVESGGTLVLGDATSSLTGLVATTSRPSDLVGASAHPPECDLAPLSDVAQISHQGWTGLGTGLDVGAPRARDDVGAPRGRDDDADVVARCFPLGDDSAWLVVVERGAGQLVTLGSSDPFVNGRLATADNAVLAAALLGPAPGDELVIVPRPPVGSGDAVLSDLVPIRVTDALWLVVAALLTAAVWRSRRLGEPVAERLPPVVPSAELARAVGDLLQRAGSRDGAAARLRADVRALAGRNLGVPATTAPAVLAELIATRLDLPGDLAATAIVDAAVASDRELAAVADATDRVRRAFLAGTVAVPASPSVPVEEHRP